MAKLDRVYNVDDLPKSDRPTGEFEPLPAGWYRARATKADLKDTAAGGSRISIRFDIMGPTHAGRVVFGSINIRNASETSERIGQQQLGEMCRAIGVPRLEDTDQLVGKTLDIRLTIKAANEKYAAGNEVKNFRAVDGASAPGPSTGAAPAKSSAAPPWAKK
jgi:hypothetical protein